MFKGCSSLSSLPDISKWNTYNITNESNLFSQCENLIISKEILKITQIKKPTTIYSYKIRKVEEEEEERENDDDEDNNDEDDYDEDL